MTSVTTTARRSYRSSVWKPKKGSFATWGSHLRPTRLVVGHNGSPCGEVDRVAGPARCSAWCLGSRIDDVSGDSSHLA